MFAIDKPSGDDPLIGPVDLEWARNCLRGMSSSSFFERYKCPALILSLREGVSPLDEGYQVLTTQRASTRGPTEQVGVTLVTRRDRKKRFRASQRITLGRSSEVDITIKIATLSKLHAYFMEKEGEGWTIVDGGSTNGTYLEAEPLKAGEPHPIGSGDTMLFGPDVAAMFLMPRDLIHYLLD